jgi:Ricin-type beta-trefoil lectin domain-like
MTLPPPPAYPTSFLIPPDIVCDYLTGLLIPNLQNPPYGFTGLMTVVPWGPSFYAPLGQLVAAGTVFLFPGNIIEEPPAYPGLLYLKGEQADPLSWTPKGTARHQLLCDLLNPGIANFTQRFIGFSTKFPWWETHQTHYDSNTCNLFWFGTKELPAPWQTTVNQALSSYLPSTVRTTISPKVQWNKTPMVLTRETNGSLGLEQRIPHDEAQVWDFVPGPTLSTGQVYYIVNPVQQPSGTFLQLFGDGKKGDALTTGPFNPNDQNGEWMIVSVTPPYSYLYNRSGNGTLVMDSRGGDGDPGTVVQLYTTNNGSGQIWTFKPPLPPLQR